jgi:hypothetical protein
VGLALEDSSKLESELCSKEYVPSKKVLGQFIENPFLN